ncbi:MAG: CDP-diacylglycerol--glycerol-3-phosphate 3-phosphatidyltransferase [Pseudomonadota bacterium]
MKITLPNFLTLLRVFAIPVLVMVFVLPWDWARVASCAIFVIAAVTDWFDGYLARRLGQESKFGAFLDPVADKLIVAVALVLVVMDQPTLPVAIPAAIIIGREIVISALREWLAELGARAAVAVSYVGKVKTAVQMTAIPVLLLRYDIWGIPVNMIGLLLLNVAAVLTFVSMMAYLRAAWPLMRDQ